MKRKLVVESLSFLANYFVTQFACHYFLVQLLQVYQEFPAHNHLAIMLSSDLTLV